MSKLSKCTVLGVGVVSACLLAACGSSGGSAAKAPGASGSTGGSSGPIKVMAIGQFQATAFSFPEMEDAIKAAAKAANDAGGINGHQITVLACNDSGDPNIAATCARSAVSDKVAAVIGSISLQDTNIFPLLEAAKIPYLGQLPLVPADYTSPESFPIDGGNPANYGNAASALVAAGCKQVGVLADDAAASKSSSELIVAGVKAAGGTVTKVVSVDSTTPDFAPSVSTLLQSGAKCLALAETPQAMAKAIGAARQSSDPSILLSASLATVPLPIVAALKGAANGMLLTESNYLPSTTQTPMMLQQFTAYKAGLTVDNPSEDAWSAMTAFVQVAKTINGTVDAASMLSALNGTTALKLETYPSPLNFAMPNPVSNYSRLFDTNSLVYKVVNNQYVLTSTTPLNSQAAIALG